MIFKLEFSNKTEFVQAKNLKEMQKEYVKEYSKEDFQEVEKVTIIDDEIAKEIFLKSNESELIDKISLHDAVCGDDFVIVGSTDWD